MLRMLKYKTEESRVMVIKKSNKFIDRNDDVNRTNNNIKKLSYFISCVCVSRNGHRYVFCNFVIENDNKKS